MVAAGSNGTMTMVPIGQVRPSPLNPRKTFDQAKLEELAASLKRAHGMLQPMVVRANSKLGGRYELAAGERRYRAAQIAQLAEVPVVIKEISDEELLEIFMIENLQRDDLNPLEEGRGYRQMIDSNPTKHSAESIAARVNKSPKHIWDRMKLLDLIKEAQKLLESGRITAGHAILIARLKAEDQKRVIDPRDEYRSGLWQLDSSTSLFTDEEDRAAEKRDGDLHGLKARSVRELEAWIARNVRFDPTQAAKAAPMLFEGTAAAVAQAEAEPGRGKKVVPITYEFRVPDGARDSSVRTFGCDHWKRADGEAKSKTCDHSVLGMVVAGPHYGESLRVCVAKDKCMVHWASEARKKRNKAAAKSKSKDSQPKGESSQDRYKREQAEEDRLGKIWDKALPEILQSIASSLAKGTPQQLMDLFADPWVIKQYGKETLKALGFDTLTLKRGWAIQILQFLAMARMVEEANGYKPWEDMSKNAGPFGGGVGAIWKKAQEEAKPKKEAKAPPAAVPEPAPKNGPAKKKPAAKKEGKPKAKGKSKASNPSPAPRAGASRSASTATPASGTTSSAKAADAPAADSQHWAQRPWTATWSESELPRFNYLKNLERIGISTPIQFLARIEVNMKGGLEPWDNIDPKADAAQLIELIIDRMEAPGAERAPTWLEQQWDDIRRWASQGYGEDITALCDRLPDFLGFAPIAGGKVAYAPAGAGKGR